MKNYIFTLACLICLLQEVVQPKMDTYFRPKFTLTKDKQTFSFPLTCQHCGEWHCSLGDIKLHFTYCIMVQCTLVCGHCAGQWQSWKCFVEHVNKRGMTKELPCSAQYKWIHTGQEVDPSPWVSATQNVCPKFLFCFPNRIYCTQLDYLHLICNRKAYRVTWSRMF